MGLHLDLERIGRENKEKKGLRKMGFLVNEGDKLTPGDKLRLQQ